MRNQSGAGRARPRPLRTLAIGAAAWSALIAATCALLLLPELAQGLPPAAALERLLAGVVIAAWVGLWLDRRGLFDWVRRRLGA